MGSNNGYEVKDIAIFGLFSLIPAAWAQTPFDVAECRAGPFAVFL
jgi:hypothetical protein